MAKLWIEKQVSMVIWLNLEPHLPLAALNSFVII
jgi:hypothetical protein